ncbi:ribosomal protein S17 [Chloropicon primus]|uniref:Ribosomal protein S17 n=1 Tax=Chloropicon primus TaxID=1764295 RepID=A0A5B8MXY4_9CHLO|nr:ribosomal protein S17 [Chloropicon primus]UPR04624.1 ribosomal protein S17 [Chloropicon primus]|eukprot:QDZ25427.1 ribosomal protein S17 [Chloropicon primus]
MQKTAVVMVERVKKHGMLDKWIKYRKKFKAHDELGECNMGDEVRIKISRPHSKTKSWIVDEVLKKNPAVLYQQSKEQASKVGGPRTTTTG